MGLLPVRHAQLHVENDLSVRSAAMSDMSPLSMHVQKEEEDPDLVLVKVEDVEPGSRSQSGLSIQEGELSIDTTTCESPLCCVSVSYVEEPHLHGHVLPLSPTDLKSTST